jgi:hypothetical protein
MSQDKPTLIDHAVILRIQGVGLEVVNKLRQDAVLPNHHNGYLSIYSDWGLQISKTYLGRQITPREAKSWNEGPIYCRTMTLEDGRTSSDIDKGLPGAVFCKGLFICYYDRDVGFDRLTNEAIVLIVALKAELLSMDQVWHRHANPEAKTYNPWFNNMLYSFGYKSEPAT